MSYTLEQLKAKWDAEKQWALENPVRAKLIDIYEFFVYRSPGHISDAWYECKYAWQRVFRGHDDRMIFSYCHMNAEQTLEVLRWMKSNKVGYPIILLDGEKDSWDNEAGIDFEKRWNDILDKMIAGFEAFIAEDDVFIKDENGKYDSTASRIECDRLDAIWQEGAALYIKHYRGLWD